MFIFLSSDGFSNTAKKASRGKELADKAPGLTGIRRPYRGIQIKDDTYSTLSVRRPDGSPIHLISSSDRWGAYGENEGGIGRVPEYADYILQSAQEQRVEKQQIIETFGEPFVYFFGERPRMLEVSGLLINTEDFNWRSQFWENYERYFRGTKLVQRNARAYLSYDTRIIEGYILNAAAMDSADSPYSVQFSFTMLVTDFYDWSEIGQTLFPGENREVPFDQYEILNEELKKRRSKFVSRGAQVRFKNLTAVADGGLFSAVRSGIKGFNEAVSFVGGITDKLHNLVGGRAVRVPIGVAGYLHAVGEPTIAAGSISSTALGAAVLGKQYDAATGQYKGVTGSVKLRMPTNALFAPPWLSAVTGTPRGYIFENVDEYPNVAQAESLADIIGYPNYLDALGRKWKRDKDVSLYNKRLAYWNTIAEGGGLLDDIADGVNFAKDAFSMVMTVSAFISDPGVAIRSSLGIGTGNPASSRISTTELEKIGVKRQVQQERQERARRYIGEKALKTFNQRANEYLESQLTAEVPTEATLGEVYRESNYVSNADPTRAGAEYEDVYGANDYTPLIDRTETVAAEEAETGFEAPSVRTPEDISNTLSEVYGDVDTPPGGVPELDPDVFTEVYETGTQSRWVRTPEERARALQEAIGAALQPPDEDTSGIIGVEDADAQIDPIV